MSSPQADFVVVNIPDDNKWFKELPRGLQIVTSCGATLSKLFSFVKRVKDVAFNDARLEDGEMPQ